MAKAERSFEWLCEKYSLKMFGSSLDELVSLWERGGVDVLEGSNRRGRTEICFARSRDLFPTTEGRCYWMLFDKHSSPFPINISNVANGIKKLVNSVDDSVFEFEWHPILGTETNIAFITATKNLELYDNSENGDYAGYLSIYNILGILRTLGYEFQRRRGTGTVQITKGFERSNLKRVKNLQDLLFVWAMSGSGYGGSPNHNINEFIEVETSKLYLQQGGYRSNTLKDNYMDCFPDVLKTVNKFTDLVSKSLSLSVLSEIELDNNRVWERSVRFADFIAQLQEKDMYD